MPRTALIRTAVAAVAALALAACGSGSGAGGEVAATPATRTVSSEFGSVELPTAPKAALGFYTTDIDILITLGVPLATSQPIRGDSGYTTWPAFFPQEQLKGITPFGNYPEYNYEKVLAAQPDLILNGLGYDKKAVERLPEIAPTYSFDGFDGSDWRVKFRTTAEALGRTTQYQAWTAKYQAKVDDVKARLAAAGRTPTVASVSYWDGKLNTSCYGVPCLVFHDLGLTITPLAKYGTDKAQEGTNLSLEKADELGDVDVAFEATEASGKSVLTTDKDLTALAAWKRLPFVANGRIHTFDMEMVYGSPSGQYAFLEVVEKALLG